MAEAHNYEDNGICCESEAESFVKSDILNGSVGQYHSQEQMYQEMLAQAGYMQPFSFDNKNSCDVHSSSCGSGRAVGGTNLLSTGCRIGRVGRMEIMARRISLFGLICQA
jgi:hypothetical protein